MAELFSAQYQGLWVVVLALALFIPVRNLILTLAIRRHIRKNGDIDDAGRANLKKRASMTSIFLCFVFSYLYTNTLF
ncbi:MAG TPA: hypothetical protein EYQ26_00100 [Rhodospirillales bacterium]|jgi:hypothetical protein|nr:hypothetical protein [Rhodospirillales bacterium]HIL76088.1 hypothetical protein [Rhodospirillales bacterium]